MSKWAFYRRQIYKLPVFCYVHPVTPGDGQEEDHPLIQVLNLRPELSQKKPLFLVTYPEWGTVLWVYKMKMKSLALRISKFISLENNQLYLLAKR